MGRLEGEYNRSAAGEWLGLIFFESTVSTVHVVWVNAAVHPSTVDLP